MYRKTVVFLSFHVRLIIKTDGGNEEKVWAVYSSLQQSM